MRDAAQMAFPPGAKIVTVTLPVLKAADHEDPTDPLGDILIFHHFGRQLIGCMTCRVPWEVAEAINGAIQFVTSPTPNPDPNAVAIVRSTAKSLPGRPPFEVGVLIF